jgi:hypothetical protein
VLAESHRYGVFDPLIDAGRENEISCACSSSRPICALCR